MQYSATLTTKELWKKFSDELRRFILKHVQDLDTAEDILQDVFVKIHVHIDSLQHEDRLESWVYQIVRHAITDHYRARKPSLNVDDIPLAIEEEEDEDAIKELAPCVKAIISALPENDRDALMMTTFGGLNQKELAEKLSISPSGARSRVQRAREKLKELLLNCCHFEFDHLGNMIDYQPRPDCCPKCRLEQNGECAPSCGT
jgi:RNA polymerase sigma-70 factor, ECF subfamily